MTEIELLARHAGLITRDQALKAGVSSATVARRVSTKEWRRVFPGVYRHAAVVVTDEVMVHAAMLWAGAEGVLSGNWAAWWHDLRPEPVGPVTVTLPRQSGLRSRTHVALRRRDLDPADVTIHRHLRVIRRPLAALESASAFDGQDVVDRAVQLHVTVPELSSTMRRFSCATGAAAARRSLAQVSDGTVSPPERTLLTALRRAGLTQVKAGVLIDLGGSRVWMDLVVENLKLVIEVDGFIAHTKQGQFGTDRTRQNALVRHKWTVLRYTPAQLRTDLPAIVAEIAATIADLGG